MSKAYGMREAIAAGIVAADIGLTAADIIIERQADVFTKINNTVSLASNGVVLVIGAMRKRNTAPKLDKPRWQCTLKISLWVLPIYDQTNKPEEDISEELENYLSGLKLNPDSPFACKEAFQVTESYDVPDPQYLVRELVVETLLQN